MSTEAIGSRSLLDGARRYLPAGLLSRNAPVVSRADAISPTITHLTHHGASVDIESIRVDGRSTQAYQITPPPHVEPQGRLFVANGWRSSVGHQHEYILNLIQAGFTVTSFDNNFTHKDTAEAKLADVRMRSKRKTHAIEHVKAAAVLETFTTFPKLPWEEVAIAAHSEGSIYGTYAATELQDQADYLILVNPAIAAKRSSVPGIVTKAAYETYMNKVSSQTSDDTAHVSDVVAYILENPLTGVPELSAAAKARDTQRIADLRKNGMLTANVHGDRDKIFPLRNMRRHRNLFDVVTVVQNGAHEIVSNPNGYANAVIETHSLLREKRQPKFASSGVVFGG